MDRDLDPIAFDLGRRVRNARLRRGMTQDEVAIVTGLSTSAVSRMELGSGASSPLAAWIVVAETVGINLLHAPRPDTHVYLAAVTNLLAIGGWQRSTDSNDGTWFDRPARPNRHLRHVQEPHERVLVRIIPTVTDLRIDVDRLVEAVGESIESAPLGSAAEGLLVVPRTTNNRRRARAIQPLSSMGWIPALRSSESRMPRYRGVVWLAPDGTRWLPAG